MLVLGIDLGTQSLKVVACDASSLAVRGQGAGRYPTHRPGPDAAEQDPRDWEAALGPAIRDALDRAGASPRDVAAIAIAAQLDGCVAVDAAGEPLHHAVIWQDRRATAHAVDPARVFALAGQIDDPGHLAPKIAFLRARGVRAARFHQPTSYLVERLTGVAVLDPALASTTLLCALATGAWSPELLASYAVERAWLPAIRPTCALAGALTTRGAALTGLVAGTPVAVGTGDDFATPLGAGVVAAGSIVCAIGTAEVVGAFTPLPILDRVAAEPMVETHLAPAGGYFVENPGWFSGGAVRWATALLGVADDAAFDALAASVPATDGVTFLPALAGAMTPVWRPHATGTFHGLAARHTGAHLARAVLEGLAFACRDVVDRLRALGLRTDDVRVLGGGATSRVWAQIRADVLGLPHHLDPRETCALGAAMIAAVAAGAHPDLVAAAGQIVVPTEPVLPADDLDAAYGRYRRLVEALAPLAATRWT
ncbi:MAG: FGGY family carbohydrate kinase [Proteobacteria bacterium]|nr:FGGY family carbohydrate kinase [Pseudomonadota bacterium]